MAAARVDRRLAAVLAADVVGYSRLMGCDETGTLLRLTTLRKEFLEPLIAEHRGRVVKLMGDGALCEFGSALEAVECAVLIQQGTAERERGRPEAERFRFRIGINLGDVIHEEGGDIYGDGVNVAARLEGLAEPGGICIARNVYDQVKAKLDFQFEAMDAHKVKNIAEPISAYRVRPGPSGVVKKQSEARASRWHGRPLAAIIAAMVLLVAVSAIGTWYAYWQPTPKPQKSTAASTDAQSTLPLPDRPSIVVLPFSNLSGSAEQGYFADALTEDIITGLARFKELFVISSNSSFKYRGQSINVKQVGRELGVQFALEGSVRRSEDRLRVTTQLIDTNSDAHLWAETYDRELNADNYFKVQDEITTKVIGALSGNYGMLYAGAADLARRKTTDSLEAYDLYVMGVKLLQTNFSQTSDKQMEQYYRQAIEKDANFALAYVGLGYVEIRSYWGGWSTDPQRTLEQALEYLIVHFTHPQ